MGLGRIGLIQPWFFRSLLEGYLGKDPCIPTTDGGWTTYKRAVNLVEAAKAKDDLVGLGLFKIDEIASAFGGDPALKITHPLFKDQQLPLVRRVDRNDLLQNESFLALQSKSEHAPQWFQKLYSWLMTYTRTSKSGRTWNPENYHNFKIVLTSKRELITGSKTSLVDVPPSDEVLRDLAVKLEGARPIVHPDIFLGISDDRRKAIRGFLIRFTGVQHLDVGAVCREAILPRILASSPAPTKDELLQYTKYCFRVLGTELGKAEEFWILTKGDEIKPAKEVFFSKEFKPTRDWETNSKYITGLSFTSTLYLDGEETDDGLRKVREFFQAGGIKSGPDNAVEEFAVGFAEELLKTSCKKVMRVEKLNFGYDIEAIALHGTKFHVEVKGFSSEDDVELTGNETEAADKYKKDYFVFVVANIPEHPKAYMVRNPSDPEIGKKDKLTIPIKTWKAYPVKV